MNQKFISEDDPLYWLRDILASKRGTLMEVGMGPIITSGMLLQFLAGFKIIDVNFSVPEDRELFQAAQKLVGLLFTFIMSGSYLFCGMYGNPSEIGLINIVILLVQLQFAGMVMLLMDELLQKGYGLGSGFTLFIATNICTSILWKSLSFTTIEGEQGTEYYGCVVAFFHFLFIKPNKLFGMQQAFFRTNAPNLISLFTTVIMVFVVIYVQSFRVELSLSSGRARGFKQPYPIKLFYTSNIPLII